MQIYTHDIFYDGGGKHLDYYTGYLLPPRQL